MRRRLVVLREALGVVGGQLAAAHVAVLDDETLDEVVVPGAARRADLRLEQLGRDQPQRAALAVHREEEMGGVRVAEREVVVDRVAAEALAQELLQAVAHRRVEAVARHRDEHRDPSTGRVEALRDRDDVRLVGLQHRHDLGSQLGPGGLEQLVPRERLEDRDGCLVVVRALDQILRGDDAPELAPQERRARRLLHVHERGEQPDQADLADHGAGRVDALEIDRVHARATVDAGWPVRLRDQQQVAALDALAQPLRHVRERHPLRVRRSLLVAEDPATAAGDQLERRSVRALDDRVVARPEEDEVMLAQPLEERDGLVDLLLAVACARSARSIDQAADHRRHVGVIRDGDPELAQRAGDLGSQALRTLGSEPLDDLDPHHRLACGRSPRRADADDRAVGRSLDAEHRVQQGLDREALGRDRAAHGVDQERRVGRVGLEHRRAVRAVDDAHRDGVAPRIHEREQAPDLAEQRLGRHALQQLERRPAQQSLRERLEGLALRPVWPLREETDDVVGDRGGRVAHSRVLP